MARADATRVISSASYSKSETQQLRDISCSERAVISELVERALNHPSVADNPVRVVSLDHVGRLVLPLTQRILSGVLCGPDGEWPNVERVRQFAQSVLMGGIPLDFFIEYPCIPLSLNVPPADHETCWLPPYLREIKRSLPTREGYLTPNSEFDVAQYRIISLIQKCLKATEPHPPVAPVLFLGSAAKIREVKCFPGDIDVGTSHELFLQCNDPNVPMQNSFYNFAHIMRREIAERREKRWESQIAYSPKHIGATWGEVLLALGVSVHRYGRAFRVTPSEVFSIERCDWETERLGQQP